MLMSCLIGPHDMYPVIMIDHNVTWQRGMSCPPGAHLGGARAAHLAPRHPHHEEVHRYRLRRPHHHVPSYFVLHLAEE